jgi:hypothetical protein
MAKGKGTVCIFKPARYNNTNNDMNLGKCLCISL